jgi:hypothetical protein
VRYEFAAVFLNKGLSPAFQLQVWTTFWISGYITGGKYPPAGVITDGFKLY